MVCPLSGTGRGNLHLPEAGLTRHQNNLPANGRIASPSVSFVTAGQD